MRIILASQSQRRKELLDLIKIKYEVIPSNVDETFENGLSLEEQSKRLAFIKAKNVFDTTSGDRIIIGSDTLVEKDGKIYGKPKDEQDAKRMLEELRNGKHNVITSLAVLAEKNGKYFEYVDLDIAKVYLKDITKTEINKWIEEGNALDKAGAYAIQSSFAVFIDKIEGNYNTVVGLPIHKLYDVLKQLKINE